MCVGVACVSMCVCCFCCLLGLCVRMCVLLPMYVLACLGLSECMLPYIAIHFGVCGYLCFFCGCVCVLSCILSYPSVCVCLPVSLRCARGCVFCGGCAWMFEVAYCVLCILYVRVAVSVNLRVALLCVRLCAVHMVVWLSGGMHCLYRMGCVGLSVLCVCLPVGIGVLWVMCDIGMCMCVLVSNGFV